MQFTLTKSDPSSKPKLSDDRQHLLSRNSEIGLPSTNTELRNSVDSEESKVKQLYNQLQEKSTELNSLLSRLRQIID